MTDRRTVRMAIAGVQVGSGLVWVWSWYTMYLEVFRWKHVTPSLRFNPGPPIPGTTIRPRPGRPLKALYVCFFGSPLVFLAMTWARQDPPFARVSCGA